MKISSNLENSKKHFWFTFLPFFLRFRTQVADLNIINIYRQLLLVPDLTQPPWRVECVGADCCDRTKCPQGEDKWCEVKKFENIMTSEMSQSLDRVFNGIPAVLYYEINRKSVF